MYSEPCPSKEKLASVVPTYQGITELDSTCRTSPVCIEALVGTRAVLVRVRFQDVVVFVLDSSVTARVGVSSFTPGAVTFT